MFKISFARGAMLSIVESFSLYDILYLFYICFITCNWSSCLFRIYVSGILWDLLAGIVVDWGVVL